MIKRVIKWSKEFDLQYAISVIYVKYLSSKLCKCGTNFFENGTNQNLFKESVS